MKSLVFRNSAETLSKTLAKSSSFFIHFAVFCVTPCAHDDYKSIWRNLLPKLRLVLKFLEAFLQPIKIQKKPSKFIEASSGFSLAYSRQFGNNSLYHERKYSCQFEYAYSRKYTWSNWYLKRKLILCQSSSRKKLPNFDVLNHNHSEHKNVDFWGSVKANFT